MKKRLLITLGSLILVLSLITALSCSSAPAQTTTALISTTSATTTTQTTPPSSTTTTTSSTTTTTTAASTTATSSSATTTTTTTQTTATSTTPTSTVTPTTITPTTTTPAIVPQFSANPDMLAYKVSEGNDSPVTVTISLSSNVTLTANWTAASSAPWVTVTPSSGTIGGNVAADINVTIKPYGGEELSSYPALITVSAPEMPEALALPVWLWVTDGSVNVFQGGAMEVDGSGDPVELVENAAAHNPTWAELTAFLLQDTTDAIPYVARGADGFVCSDFATLVHNNAETAGLRCAWIGLDLASSSEGHALNAFQTTDRGLVYIDCTGGKLNESYTNEPSDTVAYVVSGRDYGIVDINYATSPEYSFYVEYLARFNQYNTELDAYNADVSAFNIAVNSQTYYEGTPEYQAILDWEAALQLKGAELAELRAGLSETWYPSMGKVTAIYAYW